MIVLTIYCSYPDSMVYGANIGPIWGRQDPGGPHVDPMNFAQCNHSQSRGRIIGIVMVLDFTSIGSIVLVKDIALTTELSTQA